MSTTADELQSAMEGRVKDFWKDRTDFFVRNRSRTLKEGGLIEDKQTPLEKADISQENFDRIQNNLRIGREDSNWGFTEAAKYLRFEGIEVNVDITPRQLSDEEQLGLNLANVAKGSIEGTFGLASLPFMLTDAFISLIKREDKISFPFSGAIQGLGVGISDALFNLENEPENFETRAAKKVGEFVVPGAFITKGLTTAGARIVQKAPEVMSFMQKALVHMAKNPEKLQFIEAGINTTSAIAGETAVQMAAGTGNPDDVENAGWIRFGAEISSAISLSMGQRVLARFSDFARRKIVFGAAHQKKAAEIQVGDVLSEIAAADKNVLKQIAITEALEKELGIKVTADMAFQNPDIAKMVQNVIKTSPNKSAATKIVRMFEAERKRISQYTKEVAPIINKSDNLGKDLGTFIDSELAKVQNRIDDTISKAMDEAELLHPDLSHIELGEAGFMQLKIARKEANDMVDVLYNSLDNTVQYPVTKIQAGILQSKFSPRFADENVARTIAGKPLIGAKGRAQEFGGIHKDLLETMELNFGSGIKKVDLATIRDMRAEINSFISVEKNAETVVRLMAMKTGIDNQLKAAARGARGKASRVFKQANEMREQLDIKFDKGFAQVALSTDLHGISSLSPESFWKTWVRPGDSKDAVRAARQFKSIFLNEKTGKLDPIMESLIIDYVAYNLNKSIKGDKLNLIGIENWLLKHETSLKEFGVWDKFDDVGKAQQRANLATVQGVIDRHEIGKSILQTLIKSKNIRKTIRAEIDGGGIANLAKAVEETGSRPAMRAFKKEVWETILDTANTGALDSVEQMIKSPDSMLIVLLENEKVLRQALGDTHYNAIRTIARGTRRIEGRVKTFGGVADDLSQGKHVSQQQLGMAFSKIRASLQGFISPQFTAVQLANQGLDIMTSGASVKVIEEMVYDWRYAVVLMNASKTRAGKHAVRTIWTAAAVSAANFEHDDARTED